MKRCKECPATAKKPRPAPHPGPRCTTHHRLAVKARRARAHDLMVQKTYGLAAGEYSLILAYQGGRCWICRRATGATKRLAVDHDHKTEKVRGLLCGPCNQLLGHVRDDPEMLIRAAQYLLDPPAQRALAA